MRHEPRVPQDEPIRHIDKSRQDKQRAENRARVQEHQARIESYLTDLPAINSRVAKLEQFIVNGHYGLRHINAYMRYTKAI